MSAVQPPAQVFPLDVGWCGGWGGGGSEPPPPKKTEFVTAPAPNVRNEGNIGDSQGFLLVPGRQGKSVRELKPILLTSAGERGFGRSGPPFGGVWSSTEIEKSRRRAVTSRELHHHWAQRDRRLAPRKTDTPVLPCRYLPRRVGT